jgi:protein-histidine pros-kinase
VPGFSPWAEIPRMTDPTGAKQGMPCQTLKQILTSLENPTPQQVVEQIERCLSGGLGLPPRVFFETTEQAAVAVSITDPDATILYANAAFERVTGYEAAEVIGKNESILSYKATPKGYYERMWAAIKAGETWTGRLVNRRKDGNRYLAELTISPVFGDDGKIQYYLGIHRDITEMRHLQHQVASQKALIETVIDLAPTAVALLDDHDAVVLDNHEYKKLATLFDGGEPAHHVLKALFGAEGQRLKLPGDSFSEREFVVERGGSPVRWFSCSGVWFDRRETSPEVFLDPARRRYLLLVMDDITVHKRRQEEQRIAALKAMLAEGEMVQSLREAIAGAVYQLQGPVNLIEAALKMAQRRGAHGDASALIGVLREARDAGQQALDRLTQSMPSEHQESAAPVNLNEIVRDVLSISTQPLLAAGVSVEWKPAPVLPAIPGRATALRTMLKQLVDNALQAMVAHRSPVRELRIVTASVPEGVLIRVEDTGPGIPEDQRTRVFEPFFTTHRPTSRNAGMGLALAQEVVTRHGGTLRIDPHYERGCRFEVFFPRVNREVG